MSGIRVAIVLNTGKDSFDLRDSQLQKIPELSGISNVYLHNIKIFNGILFGVYHESEITKFYKKYVDKLKYPTEVDFFVSCLSRNEITPEETVCRVLVESGSLMPNIDGDYNKAFLQVRKPYGHNNPIVTMMEYL